jgi:hypothetical protein
MVAARPPRKCDIRRDQERDREQDVEPGIVHRRLKQNGRDKSPAVSLM